MVPRLPADVRLRSAVAVLTTLTQALGERAGGDHTGEGGEGLASEA